MLTSRLKILPADKAFKKTRTKDQDNVIVSPETGGYDISVFVKGQKVKTAWKSNKTSALQTARDLADFYRDENGQSLNIVTKDANPDLINMYKQKFEEAIDNGDKEEMKRWFREIMNNVTFDANTELPIGKHDDVPDDQFDADELAKGIQIEMEHTDDEVLAKSIAKDHLSEKNSSKYYSYLILLEKLMQNNVSLESIQGLLK